MASPNFGFLTLIKEVLTRARLCVNGFTSTGSNHKDKETTDDDRIHCCPIPHLTELSARSTTEVPLCQVYVNNTWLNANELEKVPCHYPMEQTHEYFLMEMYPLATILNKIAHCLKIMSIQGKFFSDPVSTALLTSDQIEMHLSVWLSKDEKYIIVEIQRRRGCSIAFHKYSASIFAAVVGNYDDLSPFTIPSNCTSMNLTTVPTTTTISKRVKDLLNNAGKSDDQSILIAQNMIENEQIDSRLLGLEMLIILTMEGEMISAARTLACKAVVLGEGPFQALQNYIFNILFKKNMGDDTFGKRPSNMSSMASTNVDEEDQSGFYDDEDEDDEWFFLDPEDVVKVGKDFPFYLVETVAVMFNMALAVFVNALEWMNCIDGILNPQAFSELNYKVTAMMIESGVVNNDSTAVPEPIVDFFLHHIRLAERMPHNATLCIRGLRCLCQNSVEVIALVNDNNQEIHDAYEIGCKSHAMLEYEAKQLISTIAAH